MKTGTPPYKIEYEHREKVVIRGRDVGKTRNSFQITARKAQLSEEDSQSVIVIELYTENCRDGYSDLVLTPDTAKAIANEILKLAKTGA
jgi:hypothetical protein